MWMFLTPKTSLALALLLSVGVLTVACGGKDRPAMKAASIRAGDELVAAQQYDRAAAAYERAVAADPGDGLLHVKLAKTPFLR